jgi:hypothetical protein
MEVIKMADDREARRCRLANKPPIRRGEVKHQRKWLRQHPTRPPPETREELLRYLFKRWRRQETDVWMKVAARVASNDRGPAPQNSPAAEAALRTGIRPECEYDEIGREIEIEKDRVVVEHDEIIREIGDNKVRVRRRGITEVTYPGVEWPQKPKTQKTLDAETKYHMIRACFRSLEETYPGERKRNIDRVVDHMKLIGVPDVEERTVETALAKAPAAPRIDLTDE